MSAVGDRKATGSKLAAARRFWGRRAPAARAACKVPRCYTKLTTRIATVSRIATSASALL